MTIYQSRKRQYSNLRSKKRVDLIDTIRDSTRVLDELADRKMQGHTHMGGRAIDEWLTEFWGFIFEAETKLNIKYDDELGYIDYPTDIWNK